MALLAFPVSSCSSASDAKNIAVSPSLRRPQMARLPGSSASRNGKRQPHWVMAPSPRAPSKEKVTKRDKRFPKLAVAGIITRELANEPEILDDTHWHTPGKWTRFKNLGLFWWTNVKNGQLPLLASKQYK